VTDTVPRRRYPWGRLLLLVVSVAFVIFLVGEFTTVRSMGSDLARADAGWATIALLAQAACFLLYGWLYQYSFRAVGVASEALRIVPVMLASMFVKTVVPLTAAPAAAVFIDDASARGQSGARTAVGLVVVVILDLVTALPFVAAGALALVLRAQLVAFALAGVFMFVAFIVALLVLLVLAAWRPAWLVELLGLLAAAVNRGAGLLGRGKPVADEWPSHAGEQLVAAVTLIPSRRRDIAVALAFGLVLHCANLASLAALFVTFRQNLDVAALVAGFGMSTVFFVIAIVPDGIGAVEGSMALVFVQLGMAPSTAIVVTLAYRVLTVWLPVAVGFWCARRLRLFGARVARTPAG
jgi:uncharacterized membrane protein YbhN (UPF0104 family)